MWQAIIWTNADLIHWHIYAALGGIELMAAACYLYTDSAKLTHRRLRKVIASTNLSDSNMFFEHLDSKQYDMFF